MLVIAAYFEVLAFICIAMLRHLFIISYRYSLRNSCYLFDVQVTTENRFLNSLVGLHVIHCVFVVLRCLRSVESQSAVETEIKIISMFNLHCGIGLEILLTFTISVYVVSMSMWKLIMTYINSSLLRKDYGHRTIVKRTQ